MTITDTRKKIEDALNALPKTHEEIAVALDTRESYVWNSGDRCPLGQYLNEVASETSVRVWYGMVTYRGFYDRSEYLTLPPHISAFLQEERSLVDQGKSRFN